MMLCALGLSTGSDPLVNLSQGKAKATSVLRDNPLFGAANAFKRAFFKTKSDRSYPWISSSLPAIVYIKLPNAVKVSAFSFRSRPEPIGLSYSANWVLQFSPRRFELVGSYDCVRWTSIFWVESTTWTTFDQEKKWDVPEEERRSFPCIGFKVWATGRTATGQAAIHDARFWEFEEFGPRKCEHNPCLNGGTCIEWKSSNFLSNNGLSRYCECPVYARGEKCDFDFRTVPDVGLYFGEDYGKGQRYSISYGLLEVNVNGKWGAVCAKNSNPDSIAKMVCNLFGGRTVQSVGEDPQTAKWGYDVILESLKCNGNEKSIKECSFKEGNNCEGDRINFRCSYYPG